MKSYRILLMITSLFLGGQLFAQGNSLLWKISGNELQEPSYLFGTIHLICPDQLVIPEKVKSSLTETEQLVLELDMDDPSLATKMQQQSINPGMKNISSELSEEDQEMLNEFFSSNYGANLSQLGILKPFVLMSMVYVKGLSCPQPGSYEVELINYAKEQEWEVYGLEEVADQMSIFDKVPVKEQLSWLTSALKDKEDFQSRTKELTESYLAEDLQKIKELSTESPEFEAIEDELLYDRNEKWIATIGKYASEKSTFFAVGAAHLPSDRGVIELLRKAGYTVTMVK